MIWLGPLHDRETVQHEETDDCGGEHCHWHGVDELWLSYRTCFECGHGYETEEHLVTAYRRGLLGTISRRSPWFRGNEWEASVVWILWRWWRVKPEQISFCPMCSHDF